MRQPDTVHGLFERQVDRSPSQIAIVYGGLEVSYRELDRRANRLAHVLAEGGVPGGSLVGIRVCHGIDLAVALLAVLKAGCAYLLLHSHQSTSGSAVDSRIAALIGEHGSLSCGAQSRSVLIDIHKNQGRSCSVTRPGIPVRADAVSHVSYTPVACATQDGSWHEYRHSDVVRVLQEQDATVGCDSSDTVLVADALSQGCGLELLWPLARGAKVIVATHRCSGDSTQEHRRSKPLGVSLFFFSAAATPERALDGYRLVLECARLGDSLGFEAIWTPERHFHEFGGLYPNPSVMSAALAVVTERISLRCGSVVAPLHDCIRLVEEWSLVDNLSRGRVGLAFASGWHANDFALAPTAYANRKEIMIAQIADFLRLWHGEDAVRTNGEGKPITVRIFPRPVQAEPQIWLASSGSIDTYRRAGQVGANLLTHLLDQDLAQLMAKISAYREARRSAGYARPGRVTLMIHAFLDGDPVLARAKARGPFKEYLRTATELWRVLFGSVGTDYLKELSQEDMEVMLDRAVERYFKQSGLFGSAESTLPLLQAFSAAGVDEVACLVDFGVSTEDALNGVYELARLKRAYEAEVADTADSLPHLLDEYQFTVVEAPASLVVSAWRWPEAIQALAGKRVVLVGTEVAEDVIQEVQRKLPAARVSRLQMPGAAQT